MENEKLKVLFFGSTKFSLASLVSLHESKYKIIGVVTQPDKPSGRGKTIKISPIKSWAIENNIPVIQPDKLKEASDYSFATTLEPDVIVVVSYGKILPLGLLTLAPFGAINVHASLLPKYRGASPIQTAILAGDKETGISIMLMDAGMDTGPILSQEKITISDKETAGSLSDKLAPLGANLLVITLSKWIKKEIKATEQHKEQSSVCKKITREDGKINWQLGSTEIEKFIRAYNPSPSAWSILGEGNQVVKIHMAENTITPQSQNSVGQIFLTLQGNLGVCCGKESALEILQIQPQGKNIMSGRDFILGRQKLLGTSFIK